MTKLTDTTVRTAKPAAKARRLFDGDGLYLEVAPSGGKWWRLKYRIGGKEKRLSMGTYPDVSLQKARKRCQQARELLADGIDPSLHRKAEKHQQRETAANSFEATAREWFEKHAPNWAPGHSAKIIQRLQRDVFPWIGSKPIALLSAADILEVVQRIANRGAIDTARRALQNIGQVMRYAVAKQRCKGDPTSALRDALPPARAGHFAATTDPERLGDILRVIDGYSGTLPVRCALRLAPLVFVRPGELRHAQWSDIDLDGAEWRFTVTKTNTQHIVPLSTQAVVILRELHPLTGRGRYVFPSARTPRGDRPMSENAVLGGLRRLGIDKSEMSGHGFRATARTILDEVLGFRPDFIEHQLAHEVRDPNGRAYNRTAHLLERRKMLQEWSNYLDQLKAGKANVVPLHRAKGA